MTYDFVMSYILPDFFVIGILFIATILLHTKE